MNRIQLACYCLIASAFVLAGLVLVRLDGAFTAPARADQIVDLESLTLMTARTAAKDESLFVIDNETSRLLVVRANLSRKKIEVVNSQDLTAIFGNRR